MRRSSVSSLAALAFVSTLAACQAAQAGDAAARRVVGFSPDGRYFAVEQYTMLYDDDAAFSEVIVVDTTTDRFVPGTPVRVEIRGDDGLDASKARADAAAKAKPLVDRLKIASPGTRVAGKPSMALDEIGIYQTREDDLAPGLDVPLPGGRTARLALAARPVAEAMCAGFGGRATPGKAMGHGLTLTLAIDGRPPITLQHDKALPKSRRCAAGYGIAEAYLHAAADGATTLAVLIEIEDNHDYHAGPNRRFMVVTRRIAP